MTTAPAVQSITIPNWRPAGVNELLRVSHWARGRRKKVDRDMVAGYCCQAGISHATGPRRVSIAITLGPRGKKQDRDNVRKSLHDALVHARVLVDDSEEWVTEGPITWVPGGDEVSTTITLEDVMEGGATETNGLTFDQLRRADLERSGRIWHPLNDWSPTDWGAAMGGECGETLNEIKKLRRIAPNPESIPGPADETMALAYRAGVARVAKELADTVIYADLTAARLGIDLGEAIRQKFNEVSHDNDCDILL